jgi:mono/diheme cytochrome c family protein
MRAPLPAFLALFLSLPAAAHAQGAPSTADIGDAAAGRRLAAMLCAGCHAGDPGFTEPLTPAASFAEIANRRASTAFRLRNVLRSPHTIMPTYNLTSREAEDIVAYILSLRRPASR